MLSGVGDGLFFLMGLRLLETARSLGTQSGSMISPDQRMRECWLFRGQLLTVLSGDLVFHPFSHKRQNPVLISSGFSSLSEGPPVPCLFSCLPFLYLNTFYNVLLFPRRRARVGAGGVWAGEEMVDGWGLGAGLRSHLVCERS